MRLALCSRRRALQCAGQPGLLTGSSLLLQGLHDSCGPQQSCPDGSTSSSAAQDCWGPPPPPLAAPLLAWRPGSPAAAWASSSASSSLGCGAAPPTAFSSAGQATTSFSAGPGGWHRRQVYWQQQQHQRYASNRSGAVRMVPHEDKRQKDQPVAPELAHQLAPLAAACSISAAEAAVAVETLGPTRRDGVLEHGMGVARFLQQLGLRQKQLAPLLQRCPYLFSMPAGQRAAVLFERLMQLGLTAAEVSRCIVAAPTLADIVDPSAAIATLATLFGGDDLSAGKERLGNLLRRSHSSARMLTRTADKLQQHIEHLQQRYELTREQVAQAVVNSFVVILSRPANFGAVEAALQRSLGLSGDGACQLVSDIVHNHPRLVGCSVATIEDRAAALVQVFGLQHVKAMASTAPTTLVHLLGVPTSVIRCSLAVLQLLGVADPVALKNPLVLGYDWLSPKRHVNLLAMQRGVGMSAAAVLQQFAVYVVNGSPEQLAGRLLYLQQLGLLGDGRQPSLLVANKAEAGRLWRQQQQVNKAAASEPPPFISMRAVAVRPAERKPTSKEPGFIELPALVAAGGTAAGLRAFQQQLPSNPAWQQLRADAAQVERLRAQLPPGLRDAEGDEPAGEPN